MLDFNGSVRALMPYVERIELGAIVPVGEPGDGSVPFMRVLRITTVSCTLEITLMAEKRDILTLETESWLTPKVYQSDDEADDDEPEE